MGSKAAVAGTILLSSPLLVGVQPAVADAGAAVARPTSPVTAARLQPNVDRSIPCLDDAISPMEPARQAERFRVGFGLSPTVTADASDRVDLFGVPLSSTEHAQVLRQLEYQSQAALNEAPIATRVGERYAGIKICHSRGGTVQILVKDESGGQGSTDGEGLEPLARDLEAAFGRTMPVELKGVPHSLSDLEELRSAVDRVRAGYFNQTGSAIRSIQVDVEHNHVRVGADGVANPAVLASLLDADRARSGISAGDAPPTSYPVDLLPETGNVEAQVNVEMMRAGNQVARAQEVEPWCTSSVTLGFSGWPETLTAGHCIGWGALSNQPWKVVDFPSFGQESKNWFGPGNTRDIATITQDKFKLANCIQMTPGNGGVCKPAVGAKNAVVNGVVWMSGHNNNVSGPLSVGFVTRGVIYDAYIPDGEPDRTQCINGFYGTTENCHVEPVMEASYPSSQGDSGAPVYGVTPTGFHPVYAGLHKGRKPTDPGGTARYVPWSAIWYATHAYLWNVPPSAHIPGA